MDNVTREWDEALERWETPYEAEASHILRLARRPPITQIEKRIGGLAGKRAVEVGCGGGSMGLACAVRGATALMLDNSEAAITSTGHNLERLEERLRTKLDVELSVADLLDGGLTPDSDLCLSDGLVEHWLDREERVGVLRAHAAGVRPGGLVAVAIPNNVHPWMAKWERLGWPWTQPDCPLREVKISAEQFAEELADAGLADVEVDGYLVWDTLSKWPKRRSTRMLVQALKALMGYDRIFRVRMSASARLKYGTWLLGMGVVPGD